MQQVMSPGYASTAMDGPEQSNRSRYGIDKLTDDHYYSWAWNCKLLLQEREVWFVVNGTLKKPGEKASMDVVAAWKKQNQEALRIISFTVIERLQSPIRMGTTANEAWEELEKVHASKDKQRKFGLLKQLYRLDMAPGSSLVEHERTFDGLVEGLAAMGRVIEPEDLVVIYSNSLPAKYNTWLQGQSSTLDEVTMSEFKGRVREETRRMINLSNGVTNE